MKSPAALTSFATSIILVSLGISVSACRERATPADTPEPEAAVTPAPDEQPPSVSTDEQAPTQESANQEEPASSHEQITKLQRSIQQREQNTQGLDAAVQMERAKLDDDPNYDQSFLHEVMQEQQRDRLEIEAAQSKLDKLTKPGE